MSFEGRLSPSFDLRCLETGRALPDGWGIGYYPGGEPSATVLKEPAPPPGSIRSQLVRAWDHLASSVFLLHMRAARWGSISDANTQPFARCWARRDWLFVHAGSLAGRLERPQDPRFEPIGSTDTEAIFCQLMAWIADQGWRTLREADPVALQNWFAQLNHLGAVTCALTDGSDLVLYADKNGVQPLFVWQILPPYAQAVFGDDDLAVDLTGRGAPARKGVIAAGSPLQPESAGLGAREREIQPGALVVLREGAIVNELAPPQGQTTTTQGDSLQSPGRGAAMRPRIAPPRRLEIHHQTIYRYTTPVERSAHILRLEPIHDRLQRLVSHELRLSVDCTWRDYDNVFGCRTRAVQIETPYTELIIDSHALVVTVDTDPLEQRPPHARTAIPLNWMPWQRHMLQPYLLPPELPEPQLNELHDYAMSFVERNGSDLVDSLLDMNRSIYEDYSYQQGITTVATTPYEVYVGRAGVCQDFTNLFICLARLLGIPARYVCGYLYTGPKHENRAVGEASHAWAQVYLPDAGWRGFDPTNGVLTQTDHVRVAVGRNYLDATPTSGTLFAGGGGESLSVLVTVEEDA